VDWRFPSESVASLTAIAATSQLPEACCDQVPAIVSITRIHILIPVRQNDFATRMWCDRRQIARTQTLNKEDNTSIRSSSSQATMIRLALFLKPAAGFSEMDDY